MTEDSKWQPEFGCRHTVIVRRSERVLAHTPSWWEDDEISHSDTWRVGRTGQDGENRRILETRKTIVTLVSIYSPIVKRVAVASRVATSGSCILSAKDVRLH